MWPYNAYHNLWATLIRSLPTFPPAVMGVLMWPYKCLPQLMGHTDSLTILPPAVMGVLMWPYVAYHNLWASLGLYIHTHYPAALEKMKSTWQQVQAFCMYMHVGGPLILCCSGASLNGFSIVGHKTSVLRTGLNQTVCPIEVMYFPSLKEALSSL